MGCPRSRQTMSGQEYLSDGERTRVTRFLIWIVGGWFFCSLLIFLVAVNNSLGSHPDTLRNSDTVFQVYQSTKYHRALALKYVGSELTRSVFRLSSWIQLGLALLALILLFYSRRKGGMALVGLFLTFGIAFLFWFYLVPHFIKLGRTVDFLAEQATSPRLQEYRNLQGMVFFLEGIQLTLLLLISVSLCSDRENESGG